MSIFQYIYDKLEQTDLNFNVEDIQINEGMDYFFITIPLKDAHLTTLKLNNLLRVFGNELIGIFVNYKRTFELYLMVRKR